MVGEGCVGVWVAGVPKPTKASAATTTIITTAIIITRDVFIKYSISILF